MSEMKTIVVQIMGKDYQINCPVGEEASLLRASRHLNDKMHEIRSGSGTIGLERIAVMAALNLSHELLTAQSHTTESDHHDRLRNLLSLVENELVNGNSLSG